MESAIFEELMGFDGSAVGDVLGKSTSDSKANENKKEETKKLKPSELLLKAIEKEGFDLSQMREVLQVKGNQLIVSCAGSGKTTALIFKLLYSFKTGYATKMVESSAGLVRVPERVWVSTFLSSGALELEASQRKWQNRLHCVDTTSAVSFSTLHAEFKRALTAMGVSTNIVKSSVNTGYLKDVVKPYQLTNGNGRPLTSDDYNNLESALAYTRNRLDNSRYEKEIYDELNIGQTIIDAILRDWKALRKKNGVCDFDDLQEMLYYECYEKNNQEVIKFLSDRYSFIYIDEFQDTSQIQYKLLQVYAINCKQVVAIGDDDQTIYSWRGSDNDIILNKFKEDFSPTISNLSINFRCPSNILNAIKPSIANNSLRFDKNLSSFNDGGLVRYASAPSYNKMISILSDCVYEDIEKGNSVAILCRKNSDGLLPALILDKLDKFSYSISGDGMTLDSYMGRTVMSIIKLFTEKSSQSVKNALNLLSWDSYAVNNLMKVCKANKLSIWTIDSKDLAYSCPSICDTILKWRNWRTSMGEIQALRLVLSDYRLNVFGKDTQFNQVMRSFIMSIESLLDYFNYDYVEDFQLELEDINERLKSRKNTSKRCDVRIATVHEFKGKEADSVYVWNDSKDVFPIKDAEYELETLEEERRIHYIACTRAKKVSTLIFLSKSPGMFIDEMDLSEAEEITKVTSGVVNALKESIEKDSNLQKFEKTMLERIEKDGCMPFMEIEEDLDDSDVFLNISSPTSNNELYSDNEFWGVE